MSYTNGGGGLAPPPWFGSPVQQPAQQGFGQGVPSSTPPQPQFPHVQPSQIPQAQTPPPQSQAQTPYQRMMQGNGIQQFQNNMGAANQQTPAAQPQGPQAQQQQPDPGLLRLLASKFGGMFGGGGSLNGATPQATANAANAQGVY